MELLEITLYAPFLCFAFISLLALVLPDSCLREWRLDLRLSHIGFHTVLLHG